MQFLVALVVVTVCVSAAPQKDLYLIKLREATPIKSSNEATLKYIPKTVSDQWEHFKSRHNKQYGVKEEIDRLNIFIENLDKIAKHNKLADNGLKPFRVGVNEYSDMRIEEIRARMNGFKMQNVTMNFGGARFSDVNVKDVPTSVDWRDKGYVTSVKNQGQCGSCWAFSATAALEGQHFRRSGNLVNLSEQQLVDCSGKYGNEGCNGGLMDNAFKYISDNGGQDTYECYKYKPEVGSLEGVWARNAGSCSALSPQQLIDCSQNYGNMGCYGGFMNYAFKYIRDNGGVDTNYCYPYEASQGKCRFKSSCVAATDKGYVDIESQNEEALMKAVAQVGPVSVAIDASHSSFQMYQSGVYDEPDCSSTQLDHGVLVVGYGTTDDGKDYWIVKNSWGTSWGENGYVRMVRNKNNQCGVATQASYPKV